MANDISPASEQLIITEETGGEAYYVKTEMHPTWPGGASGVTIGNGFDCGYATAAEIGETWQGRIPDTMVEALQTAAHVRGRPARALAHELRWVTVPWAPALGVFRQIEMPKWIGICRSDLPNWDMLRPTCKGVLVSIAFNRGDSWQIPATQDPNARYAEMRNIKSAMIDKKFEEIPAQIISMQRLWPRGGDLWNRRAHEWRLFLIGLGRNPMWMQYALNTLGLGPIDEDNVRGPQTEAALLKFTRTMADTAPDKIWEALEQAMGARAFP